MGKIVEKAYAKINLTLKVMGRRADGYHEIDSLVVFADVGDLISVEAVDVLSSPTCALDGSLSFDNFLASDISGPFDQVIPDCISLYEFSKIDLAVSGAYGGAIEGKNLVATVAECILLEMRGVKTTDLDGDRETLRLQLEKNLPVAAGVGGGSADGAALIRLFQRLGFVDFSSGQISEFGKKFGADVPVCVSSQPSVMRGIGEIVEPVGGMPSMGVLLVNPGVGVSTGAVFCALDAPLLSGYEGAGAIKDLKSEAENEMAKNGFGSIDAVIDYMKRVPNDLSIPAQSLAPVIGDVLLAIEELPMCRIARLSGSGATCFGLFADADAASQAALVIKERFPDWWVVPSVIRPC